MRRARRRVAAAAASRPALGRRRRRRLLPLRATRSLRSVAAAGVVGAVAGDGGRRPLPFRPPMTCHWPIACIASSPDTPVRSTHTKKNSHANSIISIKATTTKNSKAKSIKLSLAAAG